MVSVLLLSTVTLLEVVSCPTVGNQTPPELQPTLATSPLRLPLLLRGQLGWTGWMLLITEVSWAPLLPTASCHHYHTLLRKKRTFQSSVEIFPAAWGFSGKHHTWALLCLCSAGPLNLNGISAIITFDQRQNKTKEGKSSQCTDCVSPCHEDRQLRKLLSVNWLSPLSFLLTTDESHRCASCPSWRMKITFKQLRWQKVRFLELVCFSRLSLLKKVLFEWWLSSFILDTLLQLRWILES